MKNRPRCRSRNRQSGLLRRNPSNLQSIRRRNLLLEPLEPRLLLAADGLMAGGLSLAAHADEISTWSSVPAEKPESGAIAEPYVANEILVKLRRPAEISLRSAAADVLPMGPYDAETPSALSSVQFVSGVSSSERLFPDRAAPVGTMAISAVTGAEGERERQASELGQWYRIHLPDGADVEATLSSINVLGGVDVAEPNYQWGVADELPPVIEGLPDATTDPAYDQQWHHNNAWTWKAWDHLNHNGIYPGGTQDVVVAVIDSGVDYKHED